jgi:hypothetical protein
MQLILKIVKLYTLLNMRSSILIFLNISKKTLFKRGNAILKYLADAVQLQMQIFLKFIL